MKAKIPKLVTRVGGFAFFNLLNSAIPFLLLPILTTYLSTEEYGIIDLFYNISLIATPLIGFSIVQSITRYYYDDVDLPSFVSTVFLTLIFLGGCFVLLALLLTGVFPNAFKYFNIPSSLLYLAIIYALFSQVIEIQMVLWRLSHKIVNFGVLKVSKTILDLGLSILLVVVFKMGWQGRIFPQIIVAILFSLVSIYFLKKGNYFKNFKSIKEYRKKALRYSSPLIFHSLSAHIIGFSDRFFILSLLDINSLGIYSVGYQIGMAMSLLQSSFNQAWVPYFFENLKKNSNAAKRKIVKLTYMYVLLIAVVIYVLNSLVPFIYEHFISPGFAKGIKVVFWILLGYGFNGIYKMFANYLFYLKKTKIVSLTTIFSSILNLALNYILIKKFGIVGAAQATTITFLVLFLTVFVLTVKNYKMPWLLKK